MTRQNRTLALIAGTAAGIVLSVSPAHAAPFPKDGTVVPDSGSCARVAVGTPNACDFTPIRLRPHRHHHRKAHRHAVTFRTVR